VRVLDGFARALALAAGGILAALALFIGVEVVARALGRPIFGARDIVELGGVLVVFLAFAYCGRQGGHVAVDLFFAGLSPRARRASDLVVKLVSLAVVALLAWRGFARALAAGPADVSNLLAIPHWPFHAAIALGAGLQALLFALEAAALVAGRAMPAAADPRP
jgi:TRAP-type C4-dicarboxylate transport system permease small subunit